MNRSSSSAFALINSSFLTFTWMETPDSLSEMVTFGLLVQFGFSCTRKQSLKYCVTEATISLIQRKTLIHYFRTKLIISLKAHQFFKN